MAIVSEVMVTTVIVASPDFKLSVLEKMMENKEVGHIFITKGSQLLGVVSDGDIKRRKSYLAGTDVSNSREEQTLDTPAHQIMTRDLITLRTDSDLVDAIDLFLAHDIHSIPIIKEGNKLVGIVTGSDLLNPLTIKDCRRNSPQPFIIPFLIFTLVRYNDDRA